ncbi:MAG: glycosyltransferase family 2 protein [Lachnospiraceae bacterium]
MEKRGNKLYLVVPCYNEEEVIEKTVEVLTEKMNRLIQEKIISAESKLLFVNDGSRDKTLFLLHQATKQNSMIGVINFSTNFGHQSAILAGMLYAKDDADMVITIDADLQQDIEAMDEFIACYNRGCDIVYGVRRDRSTDGFLKKATATLYYRLLHCLGCEIITNHADYRLLSGKAIRALAEYKEVNLFIRGLIPTLGFQSDIVYFEVKKREAGQSKYTIQKMLKLATDGITSLSIKPLRIITSLGLITCLFGVFVAVFSLIGWIRGDNIAGYTTSIMITLIMNGVTLLSLGIIGEYIGKLYMEAKGRPRYIIDSVIWNNKKEEQ